MNFNSVDEILDFAIKNEQEAADFYTRLADKAEHKSMKDALLQFADEEMVHKKKLLAIKDGKIMLESEKKILDLGIAETTGDIKVSSDLSYQEVLIIAMKAEKAAFILYNKLASAVNDGNLKEIFLGLAQEEAKHKLRFEVEYDDYIYKEN
ncbi:ferritin family protein [bacterium]|nr:ferritin family protein [bacterium]